MSSARAAGYAVLENPLDYAIRRSMSAFYNKALAGSFSLDDTDFYERQKLFQKVFSLAIREKYAHEKIEDFAEAVAKDFLRDSLAEKAPHLGIYAFIHAWQNESERQLAIASIEKYICAGEGDDLNNIQEVDAKLSQKIKNDPRVNCKTSEFLSFFANKHADIVSAYRLELTNRQTTQAEITTQKIEKIDKVKSIIIADFKQQEAITFSVFAQIYEKKDAEQKEFPSQILMSPLSPTAERAPQPQIAQHQRAQPQRAQTFRSQVFDRGSGPLRRRTNTDTVLEGPRMSVLSPAVGSTALGRGSGDEPSISEPVVADPAQSLARPRKNLVRIPRNQEPSGHGV